MNHVREAMAIVSLDRPRWSLTDELGRLWEAEFGHIPAAELEKAAMHFLRTERGMPTIASFRDSIEAVRREGGPVIADAPALPAFGDLEADTEYVPADLAERHPWYDPAATMLENLALCGAHRDDGVRAPVLRSAGTSRRTGPKSIGSTFSDWATGERT